MTINQKQDDSHSHKPWGLFERYGVELEYMICDKDTLHVLPITDRVLYELAGDYVNELALDNGISCSNELALHVIEFKTEAPVDSLDYHLAMNFHREIQKINNLLEKWNAILLPSGMHPWMNPTTELKLWTHEYNPIYEAYNRIFHCQGHGWANLQSTHLNISFSTDEELKVLHSAIRWLLPIIPAISASSPFKDGKISGFIDTRLDVYQHNQEKIPSIAGLIIPEPVSTKTEYFEKILEPMWRDIAPYDSDKLLQEEWLNSRGAIARFERMAIEIRVIDIQESPLADIAILRAIVSVLKMLVQKILSKEVVYKKINTSQLKDIFLNCVKNGSKALIQDEEYLSIFSITSPCQVNQLWKAILGEEYLENDPIISQIINDGTLSERILNIFEETDSLKKTYCHLAESLQTATLLHKRKFQQADLSGMKEDA